MIGNKIILASVVLTINCFRSCINGNINQIKGEIARFEDRQIVESEVSLYDRSKYYIGFREDVNDAYYLAYKIGHDSSYEICKVFTQKNWDKKDSINNLIIEANRKLRAKNLKAIIIFDDPDSLRLFMLNSIDLSICPVESVKNINDIISLNKYSPSLYKP